MRKLKILLVCLFILMTGVGVLAVSQPKRTVILLHDGKVIPVDRTWEAGEDLFYENEKESAFVPRAQIKSIGTLGPAQRLKAAGDRCADFLGRRIHDVTPLAQDATRLADRFSDHLAVAAGGAVLVFLIAWLRRGRARHPKRQAASASAAAAGPAGLSAAENATRPMPERNDVVRFFLNLHRLELGLGPEAPSEFSRLPSSTGKNRTYELRVKGPSDWVKRRMSIGPLGEESGSKSTCYYVIFDQHLVVKIPPKPTRHFEDYVAGLKKERHIVERLAPRECIVPTVSVILDRVHPAPAGADLPADAREETHIARLRQSAESQEHLKINGSFAYFMDLSQHRFLSHIIDALHDVSEAVHAEINAAPDIIRHPDKFKDRYVSENESVGFEIRDLYNQCEAEIARQLKQQGQSALISPYRVQRWFLQYLETRRLGEVEKDIPAELAASIGYVFDAHFKKYQPSVDAFHAAVRRYAARLALEQNLPIVSGIITHLLGLLGDLHTKHVALRDLKPDNMLVAGDPQRYPAFLRSPRDYSLGIIDVETAVYFGTDGATKLRQPLLGGTPYYATPSHLMPNKVIQNCFGDPGRILHFQDWQAVIVMIYRTVTGELLFDRTAQQFVEIKVEVLRALNERRPLEEIVAELSRGFWQHAVEEFRIGMQAHEATLRQVEVELPSAARRLFLRTVQRDVASVAAVIQRLVASQPHVPSAAGRDQLLKCTHAQICRFMQDIEFRAKAGALGADSAQRALQCFKKLINLKALHERKTHLCTLLEADPARLSTYDILMFMFNMVLKGMYREDWKPLAEEPATLTCRPDDELSLSTTV